MACGWRLESADERQNGCRAVEVEPFLPDFYSFKNENNRYRIEHCLTADDYTDVYIDWQRRADH